MSDAHEADSLLFSDPIKEPVVGEGSSEDCKIGNVEKKTIFFFGQPGCLKLNSPVKTTAVEAQNNHKNDEATTSSVKESNLEDLKEENDEANLLQKISEALKDETSLEDASTLPKEVALDNDKNNKEEENSIEKKGIPDPESLNKIRSKLMENIEQEEIKILTKDSSSSEFGEKSSSTATCDAQIDQTDCSVSSEVIAKPKAFSIVPYDDDSLSSSSQMDMEPEVNDKSESIDSLLQEKSASLSSVNEPAIEQTNLSIKQLNSESAKESPHDSKMEIDDTNDKDSVEAEDDSKVEETLVETTDKVDPIEMETNSMEIDDSNSRMESDQKINENLEESKSESASESLAKSVESNNEEGALESPLELKTSGIQTPKADLGELLEQKESNKKVNENSCEMETQDNSDALNEKENVDIPETTSQDDLPTNQIETLPNTIQDIEMKVDDNPQTFDDQPSDSLDEPSTKTESKSDDINLDIKENDDAKLSENEKIEATEKLEGKDLGDDKMDVNDDDRDYEGCTPVEEPLCIKKYMEPLVDPSDEPTQSSNAQEIEPQIEATPVAQLEVQQESNEVPTESTSEEQIPNTNETEQSTMELHESKDQEEDDSKLPEIQETPELDSLVDLEQESQEPVNVKVLEKSETNIECESNNENIEPVEELPPTNVDLCKEDSIPPTPLELKDEEFSTHATNENSEESFEQLKGESSEDMKETNDEIYKESIEEDRVIEQPNQTIEELSVSNESEISMKAEAIPIEATIEDKAIPSTESHETTENVTEIKINNECHESESKSEIIKPKAELLNDDLSLKSLEKENAIADKVEASSIVGSPISSNEEKKTEAADKIVVNASSVEKEIEAADNIEVNASSVEKETEVANKLEENPSSVEKEKEVADKITSSSTEEIIAELPAKAENIPEIVEPVPTPIETNCQENVEQNVPTEENLHPEIEVDKSIEDDKILPSQEEKETEEDESEGDYDEFPEANESNDDSDEEEPANENEYEGRTPVEEPICIKKRMEPLVDPEDSPVISETIKPKFQPVEDKLQSTDDSESPKNSLNESKTKPTEASTTKEVIESPHLEIEPKTEEAKVEDLIKEETPLDLETEKKPSTAETLPFSKPSSTRKRKISERKSVSESDSEGNIVTDSVSHNSTDEEEVVQKKKPKIRGKAVQPRKVLASRKAATPKKVEEEIKSEVTEAVEPSKVSDPVKEENEPEQTLQNFKFDYDESEDLAAKVAAIKTMISKDSGPKKESDDSEDDVERKAGNKRSRKSRGRVSKRKEADSSSDEDSVKESNKSDSKRSKTQDESKESSPNKKKRETGPKGLLKYIDTSLVIDTTENEAPVRQSRRIAQQKIREETERRQMEEKLLKQMKAEAEKKKKGPNDASEEDEGEEYQKEESSEDDASYKGAPKKRKEKSKILPSDKQWQTSSSHSEHSESEDYMEHVPSDPGSPLFKSDHEFSPESDDDDAAQVQPLKRARTAKKLETVASSDEGEDINPKHACQVCHKTDSPEWILLCDDCDCGYHCSCLKPIIFLIPSGNWYCPLCCHKKLIDNLSVQLTELDTLIYNIETTELRKQRQKLAEINEQNILQERRKNRAEKSRERSQSKLASGSSESDNSSEDAPLKDYFYKLRKRNQTAAPSYRFNEYDDLINSAIRRDEMTEAVKGAGNLGRGKDIATIIEAEKEEDLNETEGNEKVANEETKEQKKEDEAESSGSDIVKTKKSMKRKKKNRKLNNLDVSSDEEHVSDEDFKGTSSSSDSEVDEEDLSMSSVSESSLDLPSKKSKGRNVRTSTRTREKRVDRRFINDGDSDSDDEPLIKTKRARKKNDSDEEEFDANDDDDEEGSLAEEIDSEDLCDDTETSDSSESNWPKKKKKRVASYDVKPRPKGPKKNENEDKAFRAGISKKKVLKKSDNESEASVSGNEEKGRRKTRGKKLLYLIEDDLDSDESDGIKPGVKRPETPPEEREMFVKKQEEIKRMLAAKDTEAAKKLAAPTIAPIHFAIEKPRTPSPLHFSNEPASLSTIPKNVIESAKALDTDYNRIKPILGGQTRGSDGNLQPMNEEELAKMMEEEDFAQHQLKLAGEAIARKKLLELEAKEEEFAAYSKVNREKEWPSQAPPTADNKKRSRKSKSSEKSNEGFPGFSKIPPGAPPMLSSNLSPLSKPPQLLGQPIHPPISKQIPPQQTLLANLMQQRPMQPQPPPYLTGPPSLTNDRPSVLSSFLSRPELHPQHLKIHQPIPPEAFNSNKPMSVQAFEEEEEKKKGRRKKFTPLRTDLVEGNISKLAKLDPPSVIQSTVNASVERIEEKSKAPRSESSKLAVAAPPQIFNPATNPTPSVITRLLQPQRPPGSVPFPQGFQEVGPTTETTNLRMYPTAEEMKNVSPSKTRTPSNMPPSNLPQGSFGENPFVPRNLHPLYRGPPGYGIPPHARLPPYPFHHLHPNLRPGEYPPYNIPPQFSYYAPPAHSRQPPQTSAVPLNHGASQPPAGTEDISNSIRNANNSEEPSETSEFGGLVSYFSSQQELD